MSVHTCHARGCTTPVPPKMFMCKPHWFALPRAHRSAIWDAYKPGQEIRKDPTLEYLHVAKAAIQWLAEQEVAPAPGGEVSEGELFDQIERVYPLFPQFGVCWVCGETLVQIPAKGDMLCTEHRHQRDEHRARKAAVQWQDQQEGGASV